MIVKVCGMREPDNIRRVEQAGPDWMGFIFFPHSSRYVSCRPAYLPEQCKRVGVFVNEKTPVILQKQMNSVFITSNYTEEKLPNNAST